MEWFGCHGDKPLEFICEHELCLDFVALKVLKYTIKWWRCSSLLRCFGWCLPPLITWPFTRTGSYQGSRVTSSLETELMDAREWSLSKDTPSSSHLVCWQGGCKTDSRSRLAATSLNIFLIMIKSIICISLLFITTYFAPKAGSTPFIRLRTRWCLEATFCTASTFLCSWPSMR